MRDLVLLLAKSLVDHPDEVEISEVEGEQSVILEIRVAPDDMGKIIGRQGRIIKALRTVVKASAARDDKRVAVEVIQ